MSDRCELCFNENSLRVFPCLYHCKKMLCIQHLSEHEKYIDKQIEDQKQLESLWKNYLIGFNEEKVQEDFQRLKNQLDQHRKLKEEIPSLLSINHFHDHHHRFQTAIQTVQKAMESKRNSYSENVQPKIEVEDEEPADDSCLSSSMTTNDESETIESSPGYFNTNGNSLPEDDYLQDVDESYDHGNSIEINNNEVIPFKDETNVTPSRNMTASKLRGCCPLTRDGVFGINAHSHGIRLCPDRQQRTFLLNRHFRRAHHLTPIASLTLARAISSGQDPMTTQLFGDHHIILNIDELRSVNCPLDQPLLHYPTLEIPHCPCHTIKQVRHLQDHLKRTHRFTTKAANLIVKLVKNDFPIHKIQFPEWLNILEPTNDI